MCLAGRQLSHSNHGLRGLVKRVRVREIRVLRRTTLALATFKNLLTALSPPPKYPLSSCPRNPSHDRQSLDAPAGLGYLTPMAAQTVSKSPQQLLQDMWELLAKEVADLKARQAEGLADDQLEDASKRLQRLVQGIRGAIKDSADYEAKQRADAANLSDTELVPALLEDPAYRRMFIQGLVNLGYKVTEAAPSYVAPAPRVAGQIAPNPPAADPVPDAERQIAPNPPAGGTPKPKKRKFMQAQPAKGQVSNILDAFVKEEPK